jgi:hypothetical protein
MQHTQAMTFQATQRFPLNSTTLASLGWQFALAPPLRGSLPSLSAAKPALGVEDRTSPAPANIKADDDDPSAVVSRCYQNPSSWHGSKADIES